MELSRCLAAAPQNGGRRLDLDIAVRAVRLSLAIPLFLEHRSSRLYGSKMAGTAIVSCVARSNWTAGGTDFHGGGTELRNTKMNTGTTIYIDCEADVCLGVYFCHLASFLDLFARRLVHKPVGQAVLIDIAAGTLIQLGGSKCTLSTPQDYNKAFSFQSLIGRVRERPSCTLYSTLTTRAPL